MKIENHFETYREDIEAYLKSLTDEKEDCYIPEYLCKEIAVYCANRMAPIISDMIHEHDREWSRSMRTTRRDIPTDELIHELKAEHEKLKSQARSQDAINRVFFPEKTETFFDDPEEDNRPACCKDHGVYGATCDTCEYGDGESEEPEPEPDNRPACCKDHVVYGLTCEICVFGEGEPEPELKTVLNILDSRHTYIREATAKELQDDLLRRGIVAKRTPKKKKGDN